LFNFVFKYSLFILIKQAYVLVGIVKIHRYDESGISGGYYSLFPPVWDLRNGTRFGSYVKISGNLLFVGSPFWATLDGENRGRAWLYNCTWIPTISCDLRWNLTGGLGNFFGSSVAFMFNNTVMVAGEYYWYQMYDIRNLSNIFRQPGFYPGKMIVFIAMKKTKNVLEPVLLLFLDF